MPFVPVSGPGAFPPTSRRIANEKALMDGLAPMGFEHITLCGLSVIDQAKLFHSASIIVAPLDAGLMNMLFASPSTALIEIAPQSYQHPLFWNVAKWLGHWYGRIITPDHGTEKRHGCGHCGGQIGH